MNFTFNVINYLVFVHYHCFILLFLNFMKILILIDLMVIDYSLNSNLIYFIK